MGALDHLSDLFDCSGGRSKHKKRKTLQIPSVVALRRLAARRRKEPATRQELEVKTAHDEEQGTWQPEEERILQHAKSSTPKINKEEKPAHDQDRLCSLDSLTHASRHLQTSYTTGLASSTADFHPNGTRQKLPTNRDQPQTETSTQKGPATKARQPRHPVCTEQHRAGNKEEGIFILFK